MKASSDNQKHFDTILVRITSDCSMLSDVIGSISSVNAHPS